MPRLQPLAMNQHLLSMHTFLHFCFFRRTLVSLLGRNYYKGVDLAMKTTTRNMLAVPVMCRSDEKDDGKVIAVREHLHLSAM